MWSDILVRFAIGGMAVSIFALIGDLFKPKSFAGLFGAAPSIALGTLWMALNEHGGTYASIEGKSMMVGAVALYIYSHIVSVVMMRYKASSIQVTTAGLLVWFACAFGIWRVFMY